MPAPRFPEARIRPAPFLVVAAGSVALLLGTLAVVGAWTGWPVLARFRAGLAFNEALGMALAGGGVLMLAIGRPAVARWLGVAIGLGALATLAQPALGVSLGIDRLFHDPAPGAEARMPAGSAVGLLLAGAGLALPARLAAPRVVVALALLTGAAIALTGALAGIPQAASWGASRPVGRAAACGLVLIGVALTTRAFARVSQPGQRRRWAPLTAGLASAAAGVLLWQALVAHQVSNMRRTVAAEATSQRARAAERFVRLAGALQSVGYSAYSLSPEEWRTQARTVVTLFPTLVAIEWISPAFSVRSIDLDARAAVPAPRDALGDAERRTLEAARAGGQATVVQVVPLPDGGFGMRVAVPIFPRGRFVGFATGLARVEELLTDEPGGAPADFAVTLAADGVQLFRTGAAAAGDAWAQSRRVPLPGDVAWTLDVAPAPHLEAAINTALPEIVLAAGLLIALALAVALRLAITLERRARELGRTNRRLALEVEQRRQAEAALQRLTHELEERVDERTRELAAANANLARSNEDLRQFGAFVAHELRQPIATAQVWADVLEQSTGEERREALQGPLAKLRIAIDRMKVLVDKELRLAADVAHEASMERVPLGPLLADVVGELRPRIEQAAARIELGSLPVVRADPSLLRRLFVNLLENALKFPRPDVPLLVRVEAETLAAENGLGPRHEIRVVDNGRGFPPEDASRIFEIFARGRSSRDVEGSGLGLAICRRIVERHGGSIRAEGRPGEGATFRVTLPRERDAPAVAPAPSRAAGGG
jgi:signal transduction histidine kinase